MLDPTEDTVVSAARSALPSEEEDGLSQTLSATLDATLAAPRSTPGSPQAGDLLDRYRILDKLGQGGMGVVYSAYDPHLDRRVAVKLVLGATPDQASTQRLLREAQALARLSHPNVVSVHDVGVVDGQLFIAMDFIDGQTLGAWLQEERTLEARLEVLRSAGRGLAAAHGAGLLHRDFKPDNVMIGVDGRVCVMDFGLARADVSSEELGAEAVSVEQPRPDERSALSVSLTQTGTMMGTPAYMSPEQLSGGAADQRSDQFAFFVVVYESIFGRRPFAAETFEELVDEVTGRQTISFPEGVEVPPSIRSALLRGLSTDPEARFSGMHAALTNLVLERSQARSRWLPTIGVMALAGAVAAVGLSGALTEDPCAAAEVAALRSWDDEAREGPSLTIVFRSSPWSSRGGPGGPGALRVDLHRARREHRSRGTRRGARRDGRGAPADRERRAPQESRAARREGAGIGARARARGRGIPPSYRPHERPLAAVVNVPCALAPQSLTLLARAKRRCTGRTASFAGARRGQRRQVRVRGTFATGCLPRTVMSC